MQKLKLFYEKYRLPLSLALVVLLCAAALLWTGWRYLPDAADTARSEPMQRECETMTPAFAGEEGVRQTLYAGNGEALYGVNLRFHIYNRVCRGTVYAEVLAPDGALLGSASLDMTALQEDAYKSFIFDTPVRMEPGKAYTLHISTAPDTAQDVISLWKSSEAMYGAWTLTENGAEADGTLAMQYVVDYVGGTIVVPYLIFAALLTAFLAGAWWLLIWRRGKPETALLVCGAALGLVFCFGTPLRGAPDEYTHIAACYAKASTVLGQPAWDNQTTLEMRACDAQPLNAPSGYTALDWKETYTGLFRGTEGKTELVPVAAKQSGDVFAPLYWAPVAAILAARGLGMGYVGMLLLGRIFNLALYLLLMWLAVRSMPFGKTTLTLLALLPMPLQLAASFCYDGTVIGMAFLYLALCLQYAYGEKQVTAKELLVLAVLGALLAPAKTIYIVLVPFCFIIPAARFWKPKLAVFCKMAVVVCVALFWLALSWADYRYLLIAPDFEAREAQQSTTSVSEPGEAVTQSSAQAYYATADESGILPNGDSKYLYTTGYILSHSKQAVALVLRSWEDQFPLYVQTMLGGRLGEVNIVTLEVNWLVLFGMLLVLGLSMIPRQGLERMWRYSPGARWWGLLLAAGVCCLATAASLTWTPINYRYLFGLQGRYFFPALPLMVLFFARGERGALTVKRELSPLLLYALCCLDALAFLEVFGQMAVRSVI